MACACVQGFACLHAQRALHWEVVHFCNGVMYLNSTPHSLDRPPRAQGAEADVCRGGALQPSLQAGTWWSRVEWVFPFWPSVCALASSRCTPWQSIVFIAMPRRPLTAHTPHSSAPGSGEAVPEITGEQPAILQAAQQEKDTPEARPEEEAQAPQALTAVNGSQIIAFHSLFSNVDGGKEGKF